jgi:diaminopimelate epimerase
MILQGFFMNVKFFKYQATGNDFILVDDREDSFPDRLEVVEFMCDRKFGIGSDGLILIRNSDEFDFEMVFYNPDGSQSLCGNGSRCAVRFAEKLGLVSGKCRFLAYDGPHEAELLSGQHVRLGMSDVQNVSQMNDGMFVDTGSPHLIRYVQEIDQVDVYGRGREIRYNNTFREKGVNINFVQLEEDGIKVRTYERGVENETLSCGTGVTAAAIATAIKGRPSPVKVSTRGGTLEVSFEKVENEVYSHVFLTGPAQEVYSGTIELTQK